jgi:RNA polymerase sigma-70 factor (ECF subfamily)
MLETTPQSVNSALQRARATLEGGLEVARRERLALPSTERERELVTAFTEAFAGDDVEGLVALFTEDGRITMPPEPLVYEGRAAIRGFLLDRVPHPRPLGTVKLIHTRANGQPAFAAYLKDSHAGVRRCMGLFVLTVTQDGITAVTRFPDTGVLAHFGLPRCL